MSNQDPFGTPPQQPFGQQPYGQQPYGQQPPGGQGFGSGPGYPPPPPPKKKTGLIIGAIVAAVVVIAGLVVGGIVVLGDDDKSEDTSSESAKDEPTDEESESPTDEPTESPTEEPTDQPTDEPTDGGSEVLGTNYSYTLPSAEWTDATSEFISNGTAVDSGVIWGESVDNNRANVIVEATSTDGSSLEEQRDVWEANLKSGGGNLERKPDVTIDGEPAYAVELQGTNDSGTEIFQSVYLTIHQDIVYSIAFTSQPADDEAEQAFDVVKGSWAWIS